MSNKADFSNIPFYSSEIITEDNINLFLPDVPEEDPVYSAAKDVAKHNGEADFLLYDSKRHKVLKFFSNYFEYIPAIVFVAFMLIFNVVTGIVMTLGYLVLALAVCYGINWSIKKELRNFSRESLEKLQEYTNSKSYTIGEYSEETGRTFEGLPKTRRIRFRVFLDKKQYGCVILEEA